jgi:triosephosphate isomerase
MYHGGPTGVELAAGIAERAKALSGAELVVAPPFTALAAVSAELDGSGIAVAAQNLHPKKEGAYTGEVSAPMLLDAGCTWVIIGHSERRQYFGETDASVREKVEAAMAAGLRPIVCVGETLSEREGGKTLDVVHRQVDAFRDLLAAPSGFAAVAYEPVWAIGTGMVAGPEQAQEVHAAIRKRLAQTSQPLADETRLLYGGSVKPDNAQRLLACADVDGALVGGASLDAASFIAIAGAQKG